MKRPTHDQANEALMNPNVPAEEALKLFERAYRRSNDMTKGFVLHMYGGVLRKARQDQQREAVQ